MVVGDLFVDINCYLSIGKVLVFVDAFPGVVDDGACNVVTLFTGGIDSFSYESKVSFLNK